MTLSLRLVRFSTADVREALFVGSTSFFRSAFMVLTNVLMNHIAGGVSMAMLAVVSIANRVMDFPFVGILGFGQG